MHVGPTNEVAVPDIANSPKNSLSMVGGASFAIIARPVTLKYRRQNPDARRPHERGRRPRHRKQPKKLVEHGGWRKLRHHRAAGDSEISSSESRCTSAPRTRSPSPTSQTAQKTR